MPTNRHQLKAKAQKIQHQAKITLWWFNIFLFGLIGVGAIALLLKVGELVLLKLGIID
jgi:hypothetical protein